MYSAYPSGYAPYTNLCLEANDMNYFTKKQSEALVLQTEIDRFDREIDEMVSDLYGLTEEERNVLEGT
jgi:ribosomal protein L25 (general stress protein Ctc)